MQELRLRVRWRGFTLIEAMITVAVVAVLAAIALPSYRDYIRRGQVPEAFNYLSDYRVKLEQYYQDFKKYGGSSCANVAAVPPWANFPVNAKYFRFACTTASGGQAYTLTATGISGQAIGHVYTVDQNNVRSTTLFKGTAPASGSCWLLKGNEC